MAHTLDRHDRHHGNLLFLIYNIKLYSFYFLNPTIMVDFDHVISYVDLCFQFGLVLVGLSSVLRDNHQGSSQGEVILGKNMSCIQDNYSQSNFHHQNVSKITPLLGSVV